MAYSSTIFTAESGNKNQQDKMPIYNHLNWLPESTDSPPLCSDMENSCTLAENVTAAGLITFAAATAIGFLNSANSSKLSISDSTGSSSIDRRLTFRSSPVLD